MTRSFTRMSCVTILGAIMACIALLSAPGAGLAAQGGPRVFINDKVAIVNGEILSEGELIFYLIVTHGAKVYSNLAQNEVIAQQAASLGVSLGPGQVDTLLQSTYTPEVLGVLKKAFSADVINQTVSTAVLSGKVQQAKVDKIVEEQKIVISDDIIKQSFERNIDDWTKPESVRFSVIEVPTEDKAIAARARIAKGETFTAVCREVSTKEASRQEGGDIGQAVPKGYFPGEYAKLQDEAFALAINQVSQPIKAEGKWYLVMPTEKVEKTVVPLDKARPYIYSTLKEAQVEPYLVEWEQKLMEEAKEEVQYPIFTKTPPPGFTPGAKGSFIAPVVGTVNGKPIIEEAFLFGLLWVYGNRGLAALENNMILSQEAKRNGIETTVEEARANLSEIYEPARLAVLDAAFSPEILNKVLINGRNAEKISYKKAEAIVKEQGIEVTETDIKSFFIANLAKWTRPDLARFSIIVTVTEKEAKLARKRITDGEDFVKVCREVSIHVPSRIVGGDCGWVRKGSTKGDEKKMEDAAFAMQIASVSQPIQVGTDWVLVKVTDKKEKFDPEYPKMHDDIRDELMMQRVDPFLAKWQDDLDLKAVITILYPIFAEIKPGRDTGGANPLSGK